MARINKITVGWAVQVFDTETREWESQEFIGSDDVSFEDAENGDPVDNSWTEFVPDLPLEMVQPEELEVLRELRQQLGVVAPDSSYMRK